jgi:hypothetical protein
MIFGFYILSEKNQIKILSKNFDKEVVKKLLQYTLMTFTSMSMERVAFLSNLYRLMDEKMNRVHVVEVLSRG